MSDLVRKFAQIGVENAPGQEGRQKEEELDIRGEPLAGTPVDFSHGDVDAHEPPPGAFEAFRKGFERGAPQAYTEYRGGRHTREDVAAKLADFTGASIDPASELIITPGTQGALFLAMGALVGQGDKVAVVEPDYFANRKLTLFFGGKIVPVRMKFLESNMGAGLDLAGLEDAFKSGVKLFLFSNPNNPTGAIYSESEIRTVASLAKHYGVALIVDELYARQIFDNRPYTHLCAQQDKPDTLITILGPSKTESLSGFRLGAAFGSTYIIDRMERLQAIVSLRAGGYNQPVLDTWFMEPQGWLEKRIAAHRAIRDDLLKIVRAVDGVKVRATEGGSYLFIRLPAMDVSMLDFVKIVRKLAGVAVTPGTEFGPRFTNWFRINFSQNHEAAVAAVERLLVVFNRYRSS
ncbi:MAG TPA: aminotransferase class I/II-fold pyridoxal phosphate-dependent enzyme [Candidatus Aminicenantes bacterium]|nr:aminotransferase class I/II-fold pyridoxal phosphate-dependent enzyme [Candidatus Aminicenantes bacterium]